MAIDNHTLKGYSTILGGFLLYFYVGNVYLAGNISPYLLAYFHQYDQTLNSSSVFLIFPWSIIVTTACYPLASWLATIGFPGRLQIAIACYGGIICVLISSYITNFWVFLFLYGSAQGASNGLCVIVPMKSAWAYFPSNKGLVSGLIVGGVGISQFLFGFVSTYLANPHEMQVGPDGFFPYEVGNRMPHTLRILCIWWTVFSTISIALVFPYHGEPVQNEVDKKKLIEADHEIELSNQNEEEGQESVNKLDQRINTEITLSDCFKSKQFWCVYSMNCLSIFIGLFVINTYKKFGQHYIKDDHFLTLVGSMCHVVGAMRFFWTWIVDRHSYKLSYTIVLCINIVFGFTLFLVVKYKALYLIWVCILISAEGAHFGLMPTICTKLFGHYGAIVFGFAFSFASFGCILSIVLVKLFLLKIGYEPFYFIGAGLSIISLAILIFVFEERKFC